ncbi:hypothetical protein K1X84_01945 [bacterium]|nr:hypothetical protein [bacterium]
MKRKINLAWLVIITLAASMAVGNSYSQIDLKKLKGKDKSKKETNDKQKSASQDGRASNNDSKKSGGSNNVALNNAVKALQNDFMALDELSRAPQWDDYNWDYKAQKYLKQIPDRIGKVRELEANHADLPKYEDLQKRFQAWYDTKGGNAANADAAGSMLAYYKGKAQLLTNAPASIVAEFMIPQLSGDNLQPSETINILSAMDYPSMADRMKTDREKFPKYFYALKNRLQKPAKGQELKDGKEIGVTTKDDEQINSSINSILLWRDKMEAAQGELAKGVSICIAKGDEVTYSNDVKMAYYESASLMARSFKSMFPDNSVFEDLTREADNALDRVMTNFAHLFTSDFHKKNIKKIIAFKNPQVVGKENPADVITEIVPGQPFYMIAYFRQTIKELGATKNDPDLGYSVATLPTAFFKDATDQSSSSSIRLYNIGGKDQEIMKKAYIIYDLLPDPDQTNYKSHLQYLPALHFTKWLLSLTPGRHDILFGLDADGYNDRFAATIQFSINLDSKSKEALKAYYEKLWAKKLSAVVFPDQYGSTDQQNEIPNRDALSKYGKLLKLTCKQTGQVMKPWPNENQVDNYVGTGFGLFERTDGKYEIIGLSFLRKPSESQFRWTALGGIPDDYALNASGYQIKPALLSFGYEIPKENIGKSGNWKQ